MDGNDKMGHSIHHAVDTALKSSQNLIFRDIGIGHFISSTKLKIGLHYSPLVKLAHGHAEVIHVATVNDGFSIGSMKKWRMHSEAELTVESYDNVQFYSIPNIDDAMNR